MPVLHLPQSNAPFWMDGRDALACQAVSAYIPVTATLTNTQTGLLCDETWQQATALLWDRRELAAWPKKVGDIKRCYFNVCAPPPWTTQPGPLHPCFTYQPNSDTNQALTALSRFNPLWVIWTKTSKHQSVRKKQVKAEKEEKEEHRGRRGELTGETIRRQEACRQQVRRTK